MKIRAGLIFRGMIQVFASDGVERELHTAGNPELLVDNAKIIPNRVLGDSQCMADLPGAHPLRQQADDFRFALSKTAHPAAWLEEAQGLELGEELKEKFKFLIVGPNLSSMHRSNAFRQEFNGVKTPEDASRAATKRRP